MTKSYKNYHPLITASLSQPSTCHPQSPVHCMQINHIGFIIFYLCVLLIIITKLINPTVNMCLTPRVDLRSEIDAANLKLDNTDLVDNCDYIDWDHIDKLNNETTNKLTVV